MSLLKQVYSEDLNLNKFKIPTIEERINYYIGNLVKKHTKINKYVLKNLTDLLKQKEKTKKSTWLNYYYSLYKKISKIDTTARFNYQMQDIMMYTNTQFYKFVKNRPSRSYDGVLLRCLDFNRHWEHYYNRPDDIDFYQKKNAVIWRGVTSGTPNRKANRFDLVKRWFKKNPDIDVGFNKITLNTNLNLDKYVVGYMDISSMLKYKYVISIEGNDKDSGIQWKLNSNSVVLMPRPTISSWLMETLLVPNYHYVLLKDDYSDLEEKLDWCNKNQSACLKIIKNANFFMKQFENDIIESYIEEQVITKYLNIIN